MAGIKGKERKGGRKEGWREEGKEERTSKMRKQREKLRKEPSIMLNRSGEYDIVTHSHLQRENFQHFTEYDFSAVGFIWVPFFRLRRFPSIPILLLVLVMNEEFYSVFSCIFKFYFIHFFIQQVLISYPFYTY